MFEAGIGIQKARMEGTKNVHKSKIRQKIEIIIGFLCLDYKTNKFIKTI